MTHTAMDEPNAAFLLGKLTEEERSEIESEFFRNAKAFESLLMTESELTDAYVSGRLSTEDRSFFEKRLLANQRQQQSALFADTLHRYASRLPPDVRGPVKPVSKWADIFRRALSVRPLLSYSFAAGAVLMVCLSTIWLITNRPKPANFSDVAETPVTYGVEPRGTSSDTEIAKKEDPSNTDNAGPTASKPSNPEQRSETDADRPPPPRRKTVQANTPSSAVATIILGLGTTRGSEPSKTFVLPVNAKNVDLRLGFEPGAFPSYFAVVETVDGQQVWRGKILGPGKKEKAGTVTISVPARRLPRGDYVVSLKGSNADGVYRSIADYAFTVDRR